MKAIEAAGFLYRAGKPALTNAEAALILRTKVSYTAKLLGRLEEAGLVSKVRHGLWAVKEINDALQLAPALTQPHHSYGSTLTAMSRRGMIEQIPKATYLVSTAYPQAIDTSYGRFVIRHVHPALYGGYESRNGVDLATPEKALFDAVYLASVKGNAHIKFPEIELPPTFDDLVLWLWVDRIPSERLRDMTRIGLEDTLRQAERVEIEDSYLVADEALVLVS